VLLGDVSGRLAETSTGSVVLPLVPAEGASVAMDSGATGAGGGVGGVGTAVATLVWGSGGLTAGAGMVVLVAVAGAVARLVGLLATEGEGL
jgi:hypothetical protein